MKWIKNLINLLVDLVTTWKVIYPIMLIIAGKLTNLFQFSTRIITINLPLWILVLISILAFYPIGNLIKFLFSRRNISNEKLYGLRWKKPIFPLENPQAYCSHSDCECRVFCKITSPEPIQIIGGINHSNNIDTQYHYHYECPIHGRLSGIPNEDIDILKKKAREALKKRK
jgi:hypothetical protein